MMLMIISPTYVIITVNGIAYPSLSLLAFRTSIKLCTTTTINNINLGWYKGEAVWEVAYKKQNGNLGYTLYEFKNGNDISEVDNL